MKDTSRKTAYNGKTIYDCIELFKEWLIANSIASDDELTQMRADIKKEVAKQKNMAWKAYQNPIIEELNQTVVLLDKLIEESPNGVFIKPIKEKLEFDAKLNPHRKNIFGAIRSALRLS